MLDCGVLDAFSRLISSPNDEVRRHVCMKMANITSGNSSQIQACLESGMIDQLVDLAPKDTLEVRKMAVAALANCSYNASKE